METLPRDVRVDHLGFVGELADEFAKPLRDRVKTDLEERGTPRVSGDAFQGLLVMVRSSWIDADKFLRLYERKKMSRAQFLAAISVKKEPALQVLSGQDLAAITSEGNATPSLRVTRIKGVEVSLIEAVKTIAAAVGQ
jgi:hypothetical protein